MSFTAAEAWRRLPAWKRVWLTALDIAVNGLKFGGPLQTLSETFAQLRDKGDRRGIEACKILDSIDPGHCDRALQFPAEDKT